MTAESPQSPHLTLPASPSFFHLPGMSPKLKSRKFWIAVLGSALIAGLTQLGIDPDLAAKLITGLLATYIGGEAFADGVSKPPHP